MASSYYDLVLILAICMTEVETSGGLTQKQQLTGHLLQFRAESKDAPICTDVQQLIPFQIEAFGATHAKTTRWHSRTGH